MNYLLIGVALFVVFANGANDNFKGFATVWGSQILSYRRALLLATLATAAGSLLSLSLANGLAQQFSGRGLVPQALVEAPSFMASVGIAAAVTVMIATRVGLPVSTTHALIGGLVGAGLAGSPGQVQFAVLWKAFLLPMLFSPMAAAVLGLLAYRLMRLRPPAKDCVCVSPPQQAIGASALPAMAVTGLPQVVVAAEAACAGAPSGTVRLSVTRLLDRLHITSAVLICFARAVNDAPKLAALVIAAHVLPGYMSSLLITAVMAAGGMLYARRVAETMSNRVTRLDNSQGLAANLITAVLVLAASRFSLPVSTTQVAVGSIAGIGAARGSVEWGTLRNVLLSWLATLPLAAVIASTISMVL